ncbi:WxL domain-containing protein [Oenococcus oeni]|uniref:WxL domain-containing protein n=1 Tax=Oenococcus oeni TaxID=1247 RepID=UPI00050F42AA|nr:WxL domain-containing protein [Oenococcus oeni]KGH57205.1 hypothetical protein X289_06330 [Oenococcus oeni IOEB_B10]
MKKISKIAPLSLLASLSLGLFALVSPISSAYADTTGSSTTSVGVTAGSLSLDSTPDLAFTSLGVGDIANATSTVNSPLDTAGNIQVTDDTGSSDGWSLAAGVTDLTNGDNTLDVSSLTINNVSITPSTDGSTTSTVWDNSASTGGTLTQALSSSNTSITLGQDTNVLAGTYSGSVNWVLTANTSAETQGAE